MKTLKIQLPGYSVVADVYEGRAEGVVLLSLIGRTSNRKKEHYQTFLQRLADKLGITTVIFDYSGHGDSPFDFDDITPAQQFLEVITVFDWIRENYPSRKVFVAGSSFGGFLATQLTKYREFDGLILRAPAIYRPSDFYTPAGREDKDSTQLYRRDVEALAAHPLLARASKFEGNVLLMVHKRDEQVPKETTDAYANAFNPEIFIVDVTHSFDDATQEQIDNYNQHVYDWLGKQINGEV